MRTRAAEGHVLKLRGIYVHIVIGTSRIRSEIRLP
jgi:hypothetical protein